MIRKQEMYCAKCRKKYKITLHNGVTKVIYCPSCGRFEDVVILSEEIIYDNEQEVVK